MNARTAVRRAQYLFLAIAIITLAYAAEVWLRARTYQESAMRDFYRNLAPKHRASVPQAPRPAPALPVVGEILGRLEIRRLGVSAMVVEGVGRDDLARAPGHIPGTALPGHHGNVGIAAHRDTYFRPLAGIRSGDVITFESPEGRHRYEVTGTRVVRPDNVGVLYPTARDTLTLVTCYPIQYVGAAPLRFIVQAVRQ
jgi:sortase A